MSATALAATESRTGLSRWWGLAVIGLAQVMILLDTTIVNIALPTAQHALGMSDANRQWVVTAYTLTFGGLLLLGGRIGDLVGRKRTFLIGTAGFIIASALGGMAQSAGVLIAARAAQGMFAALLGPSTLAMVAATFTEPRERAKAFGVFSSVAAAGGAVGLLVGGVIVQLLDWRWCFFINLPIGALVIIGGWLLLPAVAGHKQVRLDIPGAVLATLGTVALIYGFGEAASKGWRSGEVIALLIAAVVLLAAFVYVQHRSSNPLLPLHLLANRNRAGAFASIALAMTGMFGLFLFVTYQLQVVMKFSPLATGLALLPATVLTVVVNTQVTPRLMPRVPARWLIAPGLVLAATGMLLVAELTPTSSYASRLLPAQLLLGAGLGLVITPCINIATSGLPMRDIGVMSAFVGASQQVGASVGTALLNTIAASTTAAALVGAGTDPVAVAKATVHGFTVASGWAVGILLAAAVLAAVLINADQRKKAVA
jgi:EmrB/QacA subfamily drug resistance transporter